MEAISRIVRPFADLVIRKGRAYCASCGARKWFENWGHEGAHCLNCDTWYERPATPAQKAEAA